MKIFVYGWYDSGNLGDEAFKASFRQLWPTVDFYFDSAIPTSLDGYDAFWVGGGSFLDQAIKGLEKVSIPLAFIGVGAGKVIHPENAKALERAKIIVVRDSDSYDSLSQFAPPVFQASDLVFARKDLTPLNLKQTKQVLVLLNDHITPFGRNVPEWQALAHSWFIQEFSKILDRLTEKGYSISFLPLCINPRVDDRRMAAKIIGHSEYPKKYYWHVSPISEDFLREEISKSSFVFSQRFHGLVYSLLENRAVIPICIHDKFKGLSRDLTIPMLDYYGITDIEFEAIYDKIEPMLYKENRGYNLFDSYLLETQSAWQGAAHEVARIFNIC